MSLTYLQLWEIHYDLHAQARRTLMDEVHRNGVKNEGEITLQVKSKVYITVPNGDYVDEGWLISVKLGFPELEAAHRLTVQANVGVANEGRVVTGYACELSLDDLLRVIYGVTVNE